MISIDKAAAALNRAKSLLVITGAGISAESGVPTFRGADGLWGRYRAEELATWEAFERDPALVWRWYDWRRGIIGKTEPNRGHVAIARLEELLSRFYLITQNVDGLHTRSGVKGLVEIHGNLWHVRCTSCGKKGDLVEVPLTEIPPRCSCGGIVRPDVVWFGESIPEEWMIRAYGAIETCDTVIVVGTSGVVYPVASFPEQVKRQGGFVIEVNLEETPITSVAHISLFGKSGDILPGLVDALLALRGGPS